MIEEANSKTNHCWVIKIGSGLLTSNGEGLNATMIDSWVEQIVQLKSMGHRVVIVSSGAVAEGIKRLGWEKRPRTLHQLQTAAAVGQAGLIQAYEARFNKYKLLTAQVLLVHEDLSCRDRYLNAKQTLSNLLSNNVIPIINENDTVATDEIRFGDNDTLAGLVTNLIDADLLLILTDQDGVFSDDPRKDIDAKFIKSCNIDDPILEKIAKGSAGSLGRGGMITKIKAAKIAAKSGAETIIANGLKENIISRISKNECIGTKLTNTKKAISAKKQWLSNSLQSHGYLTIDEGAQEVIKKSGKSLLPIGVISVKGNFYRGDLITCIDKNGNEIAKGLINYNSDEVEKIAGKSSDKIFDILGYDGGDELIHRDNLAVIT